MSELGQSLQPVTVSNATPAAGPALRVVGYTSAPAGRGVLGGPALPVYIVSDAEVAAGAPVAGNVPLPCVLASSLPGAAAAAGQRPIPVYVVGGSLNPTPPFPTGMVARWTLDDTSAGYVDLVAGRTLSPLGTAPGVAAGVISDAADLGGAGALSLSAGSWCHPAIGTAYEIWVRPDDVSSGYVGLIGQDDPTDPLQRGLFVYQNSTNVEVFLFNTAGTLVTAVAGVLSVGVWSHIVAVITTTQSLALYVNGILAATSGVLAGTLTAPTAEFTLGCRLIGGTLSLPFDGRLDEPAIWQFGASGDPGAAFWAARYNGGAGVRP